MKLLIISFTFPPQHDGVAHVAAAQAYGLAALGHDVTVATGFEPTRTDFSPAPNLKIVQFKVDGCAHILNRYRGDIQQYIDFVAGFPADVIMCNAWHIWATDLAVRAFSANPAQGDCQPWRGSGPLAKNNQGHDSADVVAALPVVDAQDGSNG